MTIDAVNTMTPRSAACLCLLCCVWWAHGSSIIGTVGTANSVGVHVYGNTAYVANVRSGFKIVDVTDPTNIAIIGAYNTPGQCWEIIVDPAAGIAYASDYSNGIEILDVSNPSAITRIANFRTREAHEAHLHGGHLYVGDGPNGLAIIDVSTPASPTLVGTYPSPDRTFGLYVDYPARRVYMACRSKGVLVVDVSNPASPTLLGSWDSPSTAKGMFVVGTTAYLGDVGGGLIILDVADPTAIKVLSNNDLGYTGTHRVEVYGGIAYLADQAFVRVVDVSSLPPTEIESIATPSNVFGLHVVGDIVYAGCQGGTFHTIRITSLPPPPPSPPPPSPPPPSPPPPSPPPPSPPPPSPPPPSPPPPSPPPPSPPPPSPPSPPPPSPPPPSPPPPSPPPPSPPPPSPPSPPPPSPPPPSPPPPSPPPPSPPPPSPPSPPPPSPPPPSPPPPSPPPPSPPSPPPPSPPPPSPPPPSPPPPSPPPPSPPSPPPPSPPPSPPSQPPPSPPLPPPSPPPPSPPSPPPSPPPSSPPPPSTPPPTPPLSPSPGVPPPPAPATPPPLPPPAQSPPPPPPPPPLPLPPASLAAQDKSTVTETLTQVGRREVISKFIQRAAAPMVLGSAVAEGGGPAFQRLVLLNQGCHHQRELHRVLHPTQAEVDGRLATGAVVFNFASIAVVSLLYRVVLEVVVRSKLSHHLDTQGWMRYPAVPYVVFKVLYLGTVLSSFIILWDGASPVVVVVGCCVLLVCVAVPVFFYRVVRRDVPQLAYYKHQEGKESWKDPFTGSGEWVSTTRENHWVLRYGSVVKYFKQHVAWYGACDFLLSFSLATVMSIDVDTFIECGHARLAVVLLFLVHVAGLVWKRPSVRAHDGWMLCASDIFNMAGTAAIMAGYYSEDLDHWGFEVGEVLYLVTFGILTGKLVINCVVEVYALYTRRRAVLQDEAWSVPLLSEGDLCEMGTAPSASEEATPQPCLPLCFSDDPKTMSSSCSLTPTVRDRGPGVVNLPTLKLNHSEPCISTGEMMHKNREHSNASKKVRSVTGDRLRSAQSMPHLSQRSVVAKESPQQKVFHF